MFCQNAELITFLRAPRQMAPRGVNPAMETRTPPSHEQEMIPLHAEKITIERQQIVTGRVRVQLTTETREEVIDEPFTHERVEIERISIGRVVDTVPEMREEGDVTIIPVVEEVLVVERRLVLKEEIRLRRVRTSERHHETVLLREQLASIERVDADFGAPALNLPGKPSTVG